MRIGVIADTHGYLDPQVASHFADVERIVHAGDIGAAVVIDALAQIAPVVAVRGNVDAPPLSEQYPVMHTLNVEDVHILVTHIAALPERMPRELRQVYERLRPDVLICGHSHQMHAEWRELADGHTLFFNPGAAGRRGFHRVRSIGILDVRGREIRARHIELLPRSP
ncbi:MAG: metallophosphatase family protein [Chloroflexi bacterium]|nr:metallophosphatase family protein [Chloroflexota bacterium]